MSCPPVLETPRQRSGASKAALSPLALGTLASPRPLGSCLHRHILPLLSPSRSSSPFLFKVILPGLRPRVPGPGPSWSQHGLILTHRFYKDPASKSGQSQEPGLRT